MRTPLLIALFIAASVACSPSPTSPSSSPSTPAGNSCPASYCGSIGLQTHLNWTQGPGFGYHYTGTLTLTFTPAPAAGIVLEARLNTASISGTNTTDGSPTLTFQIAGDSVACQLVNPSSWLISDVSRPIPAIAILSFNWTTTGC